MSDGLFEIKIEPREKTGELFLKESLYGYLTGNLSAQDSHLLQKELTQNLVLAKEKKELEAALAYCQKLSQFQVAKEYIEFIDSNASVWNRWLLLIAWKSWPQSLRWAVEAAVISMAAVVFGIAMPWQKIFVWESNEQAQSFEVKISPLVKPISVEKVDEPKNSAVQVAAKSEPIPPPVLPVQEIQSTPEESTKSANKGFVYRGRLLPKSSEFSDQLISEISKLGGQKAGQVPLGWKRSDGSSYFHFTLPESSYSSLLAAMEASGTVRISKDPHGRVMPEGQIRIILEVSAATSGQ